MASLYRKYRSVVGFSLLALLVIFALYVNGNRFLQIEHIEVKGVGVEVVVDQQKIAKNLLFFPTDAVKQEILKQNPLVDHVELYKKYPHTLVIVASPRVALARIFSQSVVWQLDRTGMILGPDNNARALPTIKIDVPSVQIGERVKDVKVTSAISFLNTVEPFLQIDSIEGYDGKSLQAKTPKTNILFPQNEDQLHTADTLQTLFAGFRIKGILPKHIDIRFDKPTVIF